VYVSGQKKEAQRETLAVRSEVLCEWNMGLSSEWNENVNEIHSSLSAASRSSLHCEHSVAAAHSASNIFDYHFQCKTLHLSFENCRV